jgi:hypothetical protein
VPRAQRNRRHVSISRKVFQRLEAFCAANRVTAASVIEYVVRDISGGVPKNLNGYADRRVFRRSVP